MKQFIICVLGYVVLFSALTFARSAMAGEVKQIGYMPDAQFERICDKVVASRKAGNTKAIAVAINSPEYEELIETAIKFHDQERYNALINYKVMVQMDLDLAGTL